MRPELKRALRTKAHGLKPVVITGQQGVTPALLAEIDLALAHHELIKVRVNASDRQMRAELIERILAAMGAELIQAIGHVITLYRRNPALPPGLT